MQGWLQARDARRRDCLGDPAPTRVSNKHLWWCRYCDGEYDTPERAKAAHHPALDEICAECGQLEWQGHKPTCSQN